MDQLPARAGEIERALRQMEIARPAVGADQPRDGDARALAREVEGVFGRARTGRVHVDRTDTLALAVDRLEQAAAAIELAAALAEAEQRTVAEGKIDPAVRDAQILAGASVGVGDRDPQRIGRNADA